MSSRFALGQLQPVASLAAQRRLSGRNGHSRFAVSIKGIRIRNILHRDTRSMEHILPVLQIDDYDGAVDFYIKRLGFEIIMEHRHEPNFPVFMIVKNGELQLALSEHGRGHQGTEIYIYVDDIRAWHEQCKSNRVSLEHEPEQMPWGNTEMLVTDPFRNALRFSQIGTNEGTNTPNK